MKVLYVSHEASRTGAPIVLLHFLRWLSARVPEPPDLLLLRGGELEPEFRKVAKVTVLESCRPPASLLDKFLRRVPGLEHRLLAKWQARVARAMNSPRFDLVYLNTTATGLALDFLGAQACPVLTHVHELEPTIQHYVGQEPFRRVCNRTSRYIAVSEAVRDNLTVNHQIPPDKIDLILPFIQVPPYPESGALNQRTALAERLGIPGDAMVVGAVGSPFWRKGIDLLVPLARVIGRKKTERQVHFVWVGGADGSETICQMRYDARHAGVADRIHHVPNTPNVLQWIAGFDALALLSREDPYPLVALEAASLGKPVLCFEGAGGIPDFVGSECGHVSPYLDLDDMARFILLLLSDSRLGHQIGRSGRAKVAAINSVDALAPKVFEVIRSLVASGSARFELAKR